MGYGAAPSIDVTDHPPAVGETTQLPPGGDATAGADGSPTDEYVSDGRRQRRIGGLHLDDRPARLSRLAVDAHNEIPKAVARVIRRASRPDFLLLIVHQFADRLHALVRYE